MRAAEISIDGRRHTTWSSCRTWPNVKDRPDRRAIEAISDDGWTPIHYPNAIWDEDEQRLISDAEVAETCISA